MAKVYEVTPDMISKLSAGQIFKNFSELARCLEVLDDKGKPITGNSRPAFLEELDRFVVLKKAGRQIIIKSIRPEDESQLVVTESLLTLFRNCSSTTSTPFVSRNHVTALNCYGRRKTSGRPVEWLGVITDGGDEMPRRKMMRLLPRRFGKWSEVSN